LSKVDNETLARLMANEKAMAALMSIEGFRNLNQDIGAIIYKSEAVKPSAMPMTEHFPEKKGEKGPQPAEADDEARLSDEELIEAYRGTVSLPFEPGGHRRIESLEVMTVLSEAEGEEER
jgi:hypothetical protein